MRELEPHSAGALNDALVSAIETAGLTEDRELAIFRAYEGLNPDEMNGTVGWSWWRKIWFRLRD